jgi:hypothetical protein
MISRGSLVTVVASGAQGRVVWPARNGPVLMHASMEDPALMNISVFTVLFDDGEVRLYTDEALRESE